MLGVPSLVLFVCVGLAVVESPSTRIRSPFELGAELVATLAGRAGFIIGGWLILQIGYELIEFSAQ